MKAKGSLTGAGCGRGENESCVFLGGEEMGVTIGDDSAVWSVVEMSELEVSSLLSDACRKKKQVHATGTYNV